MKKSKLMTLLVVVLFTLTAYAQNKENLKREMMLRRGIGPVAKTNYDSLLTVFKPTADEYQLLQVKPSMTEEQRRFIIQGNSWQEQMQYPKAIELYKQAIDLNPTSYPSGYFNLALLYEITNNYNAAIFNMKKYLMLVPNAEDARSAQDKIYEWEAKVGR